MIQIDEQLPKMVDISAEFSRMSKDGKQSSLYHAMDEDMLNKLINKGKKVLTAEEGWSYVTSPEKDLAVFFRGDEQCTIGHDIGTHRAFDACVYEGSKKKIERLIKSISSLSGITLAGEVKESAPYLVIPERVVSQAVSSSRNNIDEAVLSAIKSAQKPIYPYVINASIEREIKNNIKEGELERALYGYADIQRAVDGSLRRLYDENKIYMENNLICLMDKSKFKDNEFNAVLNFRDASCDDTFLIRDIDTQKNTTRSCEIWTIKDREGKDVVNLYLKQPNFGSEPSLYKEDVLAFVNDNRDIFLQQQKKSTVWKSRILQEAFLNRFERIDSNQIEPVVPKKAYSIAKARSADEKVHDEFMQVVQVEEKIANGEYKLSKEVHDKLKNRSLSRMNRYARSSAEEAGVIIDDFIGDNVKETNNIGQALVTLREKEVLDDWFADAKESIHIGTFRSVMQYSEDGNTTMLDPLMPEGAVRIPSALDEFVILTKQGALLQIDVSEQVGKEAYALFNIKDKELARSQTMKEFLTIADKCSNNIRQNLIYHDFVPQKYWFDKEQRDTYLHEQKMQFVEKPFGNRFEKIVLQKENTNDKKQQAENKEKVTMFIKPETVRAGVENGQRGFFINGNDDKGDFNVFIPSTGRNVDVKILSNSKKYKDWLVATSNVAVKFKKAYKNKVEFVDSKAVEEIVKSANRQVDKEKQQQKKVGKEAGMEM